MSNTSRKSLTVALALTTALAAPLAFGQETGTETGTYEQEQAQPTEQTETMNAAEPAKKSWAEIDLDQDGSVNKDEAAAVPALAEVFDQADADADGLLTSEEYRNFVAQSGEPEQDDSN